MLVQATGGTARQMAQAQQGARGVQEEQARGAAAARQGQPAGTAQQAQAVGTAQEAARQAGQAAAVFEDAQKRAEEAFAPEEAEVKNLIEMMKEAKERAEEQRERFKLPKNTRYGDAPMTAYSRLARARTQAQVGAAAGYARSKIAQLQSALRQDPDHAERIRAAIGSLQKAVQRAGKKKRELQQEQLAERRRARAAMRKENGKAQRLRAELNRKRALRKVRESGYLRECEVDNRIQDQLQASRTELRLQMQQLTAAVAPQSPEMAAKLYAAQAGTAAAPAAPAAGVDIQA